ncbi:MAG: MarR family transcriptional regulator [Oscillospiraceae bacterium]|nr:MarR family transcriptional regulator [Oscillospiraceae bacterium]MBR3554564.1 MarR family transcriptional regulator [Oscillospiraceae bacterium]
MGREERRPEDRRREEHDRPESHVPGTALGKLALCGRLAEQHRGRRRGQMHILRILEENGSMSQRVLQELLQIQPGSMSEIAAKLEVGGLIRRERSEEDKRRVTVSITEKGKETLAALPQGAPDTLEPLTEEEQKLLTELLDKLIDAWGAERRGPHRGGFGPDRGPRGPRPPMRRGPERL